LLEKVGFHLNKAENGVTTIQIVQTKRNVSNGDLGTYPNVYNTFLKCFFPDSEYALMS